MYAVELHNMNGHFCTLPEGRRTRLERERLLNLWEGGKDWSSCATNVSTPHSVPQQYKLLPYAASMFHSPNWPEFSPSAHIDPTTQAFWLQKTVAFRQYQHVFAYYYIFCLSFHTDWSLINAGGRLRKGSCQKNKIISSFVGCLVSVQRRCLYHLMLNQK
jgi:hypothetical protein